MEVLFESSTLWAVNKAPKIHYDAYVNNGAPMGFEPVHRLDFETSGVLIYGAKATYPALLEAFKTPGKIKKIYLAGSEKPLMCPLGLKQGFIASRYRSSKKVSYFEREAMSGDEEDFREFPQEYAPRDLKNFRSVQVAEHFISKHPDLKTEPYEFKGHQYQVELISGARHQIRAYFAKQHAPLLGDPIYGNANSAERLELHSLSCEIHLAELGADRLKIIAHKILKGA